ncbi:MAG: pyridoxamine 5'-phosphate oxidase family protein [Azospirillaceae bacterium]
MTTIAPTERTRLRRAHERGSHDSQDIHAILDASIVAHVGHVIDGSPVVIPTLHWREGDRVYWHGSAASRMLRAVEEAPVCLTVTQIDGLVLARSAFHHSVNYRSAMLFGIARKVTDPASKEAHLRTMIEGLFPGRWDALRPINGQELKATTVMWMPIDEASAKVRSGAPKDDEEDYALPIWAGVVPFATALQAPLDCPRQHAAAAPPTKALRALAGKLGFDAAALSGPSARAAS